VKRIVKGIEASLAIKWGVGNIVSRGPPEVEVDDESEEWKVVREDLLKINRESRAKTAATRSASKQATQSLVEQVASLAAMVAQLTNQQSAPTPAAAPVEPPEPTFTQWNGGLFIARDKHSDETRASRKDRVIEVTDYRAEDDMILGKQVGGKSDLFRIKRTVWETGLRHRQYISIREPSQYRIRIPQDQE
jgi:hypothetical protein